MPAKPAAGAAVRHAARRAVDVAPTEEDYKPHFWEKPHMGNPTGTPGAIRPDGSTLRPGPRQPTGGDYEAWTPGL
jgi:NADH:ubiquinone oxidoreductase subunit